MKILLQDTVTGLYLSRGGGWTDNPEGALAFISEVRAQDIGIYHHLPNAKAVLVPAPGAVEISTAMAAGAAKTNMNTKAIMNTKDTTIQTTKPPRRKPSRPGSAKATSPAQPTASIHQEKVQDQLAPAGSPNGHSVPPAKQITVVHAKIDVGLGNKVFIRGQGNGLTWLEGVPLDCVDGTTWVWSTRQAKEKVVFKLLLNDQVWAKGEDVVVEAGRKIEVVPLF